MLHREKRRTEYNSVLLKLVLICKSCHSCERHCKHLLRAQAPTGGESSDFWRLWHRPKQLYHSSVQYLGGVQVYMVVIAFWSFPPATQQLHNSEPSAAHSHANFCQTSLSLHILETPPFHDQSGSSRALFPLGLWSRWVLNCSQSTPAQL